MRKEEKKRISLTWEKFFKNIGNKFMNSREGNKMEQLDLEEVKDFLENKGIADGVELKPKENGVYWLSIKQEFQTMEKNGGTIIKINGFTLFVKSYIPLVGLSGKAKKALLLKPAQAAKA